MWWVGLALDFAANGFFVAYAAYMLENLLLYAQFLAVIMATGLPVLFFGFDSGVLVSPTLADRTEKSPIGRLAREVFLVWGLVWFLAWILVVCRLEFLDAQKLNGVDAVMIMA